MTQSPMSNFRSLISRVLKRLRRTSRPSLNDLDRKLSKYLDFRGGFFIEAGANDGYAQSNTYYLERSLGWTGLLVEGIPELSEACAKTRPRSLVRNCALVADDFSAPTVMMHYASLMSVVDGSMRTEAAQESHIRSGLDVQNIANSYDVEVPARTLASLLAEIPGLAKIDFMSLDVEGYELNVLRGMNISKFRPTYILVEARFFDEVDAFLTSNRYEMVERLSVHDYLYMAR